MYPVRVFAVGALFVTGVAQASLIQNGSFEESFRDPGAGFLMLNGGDTSIDGWTVVGTGIDYIGGVWAASDGLRSLDLNQRSAGGGIAQTFATEIGQSYIVEFDLSANMYNAPNEKIMGISAAGQEEELSFNHLLLGSSPSDPKWERRSWSFVATSTQTTLRFEGISAGAYGAALDNVSVVAQTPAPAAIGLFGVAGFVAGRRRR